VQARGIWAGPANQVRLVRTGSDPAACHAFLIVVAQIAAMPKRLKPFQREVRRSRNLTALIFTDGAMTTECHLLDVSHHGAKVVVEMPSLIPNQYELAFSLSNNKRRCEVVWRRNKVLGVKFT
jgi:PilZ domain